MGRVICIGNHKGGVGKTTTAVNLSAAFAVAEKRTLLIDSDPQGHSTIGMGINNGRIAGNLFNALLGDASIDELIVKGDIDCLKILPSGLELIRAEAELISMPGKETVLRDLIKTHKDRYDYILIDCPPSLNLLTVNAMAASDSVLIPLQCEFFAGQGLIQFLEIYKVLKRIFNPEMQVEGILLTMVDKYDEVSEKIAGETRRRFNGMVFNASIPRDRLLHHSASSGKPLLLQDIASAGARAYLDLAKEIMSGDLTLKKDFSNLHA